MEGSAAGASTTASASTTVSASAASTGGSAVMVAEGETVVTDPRANVKKDLHS